MSLLLERFDIITGAGSEIGKSIAIAFAKEGAKTVFVSRNQAKLEAVAEKIRAAGGTAFATPMNDGNF